MASCLFRSRVALVVQQRKTLLRKTWNSVIDRNAGPEFGPSSISLSCQTLGVCGLGIWAGASKFRVKSEYVRLMVHLA